MTRDVLQKRKLLEANISNLKAHVHMMELKQNKLKQTQEALEKNKKYVKNIKNFEYETEVPYKQKVDIDLSVARVAVCCSVCEENCVYPDSVWAKNLSWFSSMRNNHCTVCTKKCHYNKHVKDAKIYVTKTKKEKRTYEELKKKYDDKIGDGEAVVQKLEEELQELEREKIKLRSSSSAASSRPISTSTKQHTKPAATTTQPQQNTEPEVKQSFHPAKRYPFPKCQGPCPKLVLDSEPPKQP
ncbi:unnamed protein product [Leuciscus chuanchicus]